MGRTALVTGASSGLGRAVAVHLARAGMHLALGARRIDELERTALQVGEVAEVTVDPVSIDVTDPDACHRFVRRAVHRFGAVDLLVNCAGIASAVPATKEAPDEFRRVIDVNLLGSYWMARAVAPVMHRGGSIVNVGSVLGRTSFGMPQAAYSSSKAGLQALTRDLAQQWADRKGIRVNLVELGLFATEMLDEYPPGFADSVVSSRVPMRRVGRSDEFAAVVMFLGSDAASYITGACIPVDGGLLTS